MVQVPQSMALLRTVVEEKFGVVKGANLKIEFWNPEFEAWLLIEDNKDVLEMSGTKGATLRVAELAAPRRSPTGLVTPRKVDNGIGSDMAVTPATKSEGTLGLPVSDTDSELVGDGNDSAHSVQAGESVLGGHMNSRSGRLAGSAASPGSSAGSPVAAVGISAFLAKHKDKFAKNLVDQQRVAMEQVSDAFNEIHAKIIQNSFNTDNRITQHKTIIQQTFKTKIFS